MIKGDNKRRHMQGPLLFIHFNTGEILRQLTAAVRRICGSLLIPLIKIICGTIQRQDNIRATRPRLNIPRIPSPYFQL